MTLKTGKTILFSARDHDDELRVGIFKVAKSCDMKKLAAEFLDEQGTAQAVDFDGFVEWLTVRGFVKSQDFQTVHLGEAGTFDEALVD